MWELGRFLEKIAKGWAALTAVLFVYFVWRVLSYPGPVADTAYLRGSVSASYLVDCIVFGFIPAGLIYAIGRALMHYGTRKQ